jgi:hypothetical protein
MEPNAPPSLADLANRFPAVLEKLSHAALDSATARTQQEAFGAGCELLTQLLARLEVNEDNNLVALDASLRDFLVSIPTERLDSFLSAKASVLKRLGLREPQVQAATDALSAVGTSGGLRELKIDAKQVLGALRVLRGGLCRAQAVTQRGWKLSSETVEHALHTALDACVIAGDLVAIPASVSTGPLGFTAAALLAVGSVGGGLSSLLKHVDRFLGSLKSDEDGEAAHGEHVAAMDAVRKAGSPERYKLKPNRKNDH